MKNEEQNNPKSYHDLASSNHGNSGDCWMMEVPHRLI